MYQKTSFSILIILIMFCFGCQSKLKFVVTNKDLETIDSLQVSVTGNSYWIVNLEPNQSKGIVIEPSGESDIKLKADNGRLLTVEVYFEPGQSGTIEAEITRDSILSFSKSNY